QRTRVVVVFGDTEAGRKVNERLGLDLQFAGYLIDSNLIRFAHALRWLLDRCYSDFASSRWFSLLSFSAGDTSSCRSFAAAGASSSVAAFCAAEVSSVASIVSAVSAEPSSAAAAPCCPASAASSPSVVSALAAPSSAAPASVPLS